GYLLPAFQLALGISTNLAENPLVARPIAPASGSDVRIIGSQLAFDGLFALGLGQRIELDLDLPITALQSGDDTSRLGVPRLPASIHSSGLGDLRLTPKIRLVGSNDGGFGLLLVPALTLPTGDDQAFLSEGQATIRPGVVAAYRVSGYDF